MLLVMSLQDSFPLIARCSIARIDLFYKKEKNPFHNLLVLFLLLGTYYTFFMCNNIITIFLHYAWRTCTSILYLPPVSCL